MVPAELMTWAGRLVVAVLCVVWAAALWVSVTEGPDAHRRKHARGKR